jgi:hypothetical protein
MAKSIQEQLTEAFNIQRGWRQGDALPTTLFKYGIVERDKEY